MSSKSEDSGVSMLRELGPYRVERVLGVGGMGMVLRGRHRTTGALVAIKTVLTANPVFATAVHREIRALASVSHPGVVQVLDHGESPQGPWYAMALLAGESLSSAWQLGGGDGNGGGRHVCVRCAGS